MDFRVLCAAPFSYLSLSSRLWYASALLLSEGPGKLVADAWRVSGGCVADEWPILRVRRTHEWPTSAHGTPML